jgi:signal transduction histidine kinase
MNSKSPGFARFLLVFIALLLIGAVAFCAISLPRNYGTRIAENGILDLTGADFERSLHPLDGEWEFYYGRLYAPEDFAAGEPEGKEAIAVPGNWTTQARPKTGFATYRLCVLADETELMLFIPEIAASSVVYVNGERVFEAGAVGVSEAESRMGARAAFLPVRAENGGVELVIWVSNHQWAQGGLSQHFEIGRVETLLRDAQTRYMLLAFFIGAVLMMGAYHFILFLHRRADKAYLLFTLLCLMMAARFVLETNAFAELLLPDGMGLALARVYLALLVAWSAAVVFFTHEALGVSYGGKLRRAIYGVTLLGAFALALAAPFTTVRILWINIAIIIPMAMTVIAAARKKSLWGNPYNALYLVALSGFIVWGLLTKVLLGDLLFVPGVASNLFLILSQCILLSVGYAEAREKEQELTAQNAVLDQTARIRADMLGILSHEVRTPLTVMSAYAQYVAEQLRGQKGGIDPQAEQDLAAISEEAKRLSELTTNALRLSRMGTAEAADETAPSEIAPFDIGEAARLIAGLFRPVAEKQGRALTLSLPDDLPDVKGNPDDLSRLLWNLLDNALTHAKRGGIEVGGAFDGSRVRVTVRDGGAGIPPELLPRVFGRGVSGREGGTGMGLAFCKEIALRHGGDMIVESEQGQGTAATVVLPIYQ